MSLTVTCQNAFSVGLKLGAPFAANIILGKIFRFPESSDDLLKWSGVAALVANVNTAALHIYCKSIDPQKKNAYDTTVRSIINPLIFCLINSSKFKNSSQFSKPFCSGIGISFTLEVIRLLIGKYIRCCPQMEPHPLAQRLMDASSPVAISPGNFETPEGVPSYAYRSAQPAFSGAGSIQIEGSASYFVQNQNGEGNSVVQPGSVLYPPLEGDALSEEGQPQRDVGEQIKRIIDNFP